MNFKKSSETDTTIIWQRNNLLVSVGVNYSDKVYVSASLAIKTKENEFQYIGELETMIATPEKMYFGEFHLEPTIVDVENMQVFLTLKETIEDD